MDKNSCTSSLTMSHYISRPCPSQVSDVAGFESSEPAIHQMTQENDSGMIPVLIEVTPGSDVIDTLINIASNRDMGIYILSGIGVLSYVLVRNHLFPAPDLHVVGPITMLGLTGAYFHDCYMPPPPPPLPMLFHPMLAPIPSWSMCSPFAVSLSGVDARVFGGIVAGRIIAADTVRVTALLIKKRRFVRFSINHDGGGGDDYEDDNNNNGGENSGSEIRGTEIDVVAAAAVDGGGGAAGSSCKDNKNNTNGGLNHGTTHHAD